MALWSPGELDGRRRSRRGGRHRAARRRAAAGARQSPPPWGVPGVWGRSPRGAVVASLGTGMAVGKPWPPAGDQQEGGLAAGSAGSRGGPRVQGRPPDPPTADDLRSAPSGSSIPPPAPTAGRGTPVRSGPQPSGRSYSPRSARRCERVAGAHQRHHEGHWSHAPSPILPLEISDRQVDRPSRF